MAKSVKQPVETLLYIKQVRIRNYAPIRDAKVSFKSGLNIIIGANGMGKTRFLNLTSRLTKWFEVLDKGVGSELVLGYDEDIKILFELPKPVEEAALIFRPNTSPTTSVKIVYKGKQWIESTVGDTWLETGIDFLEIESILAKHGTPFQGMPLVDTSATLTFGGNSAMRVEMTAEVAEAVESTAFVRTIFNTLIWSNNRRRRYQQLDKSVSKFSIEEARAEVERVVKAYLDFLNPILIDYSPVEQVRLSSSFQVYDNAFQEEIIVKGLVLEYCAAGRWLPFTALSDGTKRMLYLISQLVMPVARFDVQITVPATFFLYTNPKLIFLEEPELGIHPDQLQKLLTLIREVSDKHQVIMTTHSPQVLDMLRKDELDRITICELDPRKGTQFRKLSAATKAKAKAYMRDDSYLSDFWRFSTLESRD